MENKTKLHLCCGTRYFGDDWVHADGNEYPHALRIRDLNHLPFKDDQFELIYCSHAISYFDREEIIPILKEWKRVLKTGGKLRLATPDFDTISHLYRMGKYNLDELQGLLYGKWSYETGNLNKHIYFKTAYDYVSLKRLLLSVGFTSVTLYDFRDTEHSEFDDHSKAHLPHDPESIRTGVFKESQTHVSLNVECKKP